MHEDPHLVTPERWKRLRAAIDSALEASSPTEREAALVHACAGDPTLLSEARSIMQAAGTGDDLLGSPANRTSEDEGAETGPSLLDRRLALQLAAELRGSFVDQESGDQAEQPTHDWRSAAPSHPRFEILRRLGEGGMGVVYLAFDREHQARVALKTSLIGGADGATRTAASISEMRTLGVKNPEPMARAFVPLVHRLSGS